MTWAVEALVASTLLMLGVLTLRAPVRRAFGPQVAYSLWALPALRLLLPPLPAEWTDAAPLPIARAGEAVAVLIVPAAEPLAAPAAALPWGVAVATAWAAGAILFFAGHWLRHRRFCARLLAGATPIGQVDGVQVVESAAAAGPLAFGTGTRYVAFPPDFADRYDEAERDLALAHELGHHARGDLVANWAALGFLALHWFNPVAWRAHRAFRSDQEFANDARVLAVRGRAERHAYACAIVKAAHGHAVSPTCHLHTALTAEGADLKGRLRMLTRTHPSRRRANAGIASVAALVAAGLAATASGTEAAAAVSDRIEAAVQAAVPAPPAPPVPPAPVVQPAPVAPPAAAPRSVKRVVVVKDGKTTTYEGEAADAYARDNKLPIPPVPGVVDLAGAKGAPVVVTGPDGKRMTLFMRRSGDGAVPANFPDIVTRACVDGADGPAGQTVLNGEGDGKRVVVICRNRIDRMADAAMLNVRLGQGSALSSIATARAAITADRNLTDEQRRRALEGLDEAAKELRAEKQGG